MNNRPKPGDHIWFCEYRKGEYDYPETWSVTEHVVVNPILDGKDPNGFWTELADYSAGQFYHHNGAGYLTKYAALRAILSVVTLDLEHYRKLIDENNKLQWALEAELAKEKPDAARS